MRPFIPLLIKIVFEENQIKDPSLTFIYNKNRAKIPD